MSVLVDTSIWIEHFRRGSEELSALLEAGDVVAHPFVIGELACGNLRQREVTLALLQELPTAPLASHDEAILLVETHGLAGRGIGYIDIHLLASCALGSHAVWTRDRRLGEVAETLGLRAPATT